MAFHIWERTEAGKLPQPVRAYMKKRFMLTVDYIDNLRYFESDDEFHGEPVKRLHIFSMEEARNAGLLIRKASELEQHPEIILFEGYTDDLGRVYVADRRMPSKAVVKKTNMTLLHILTVLRFRNLGRGRGVGSVGSKLCGADTGGNIGSNTMTGEVMSGLGGETLYKKAEEHAPPRAGPIKKIGSYGPGASWPHSYETRELREWLNAWEGKKDSE